MFIGKIGRRRRKERRNAKEEEENGEKMLKIRD